MNSRERKRSEANPSQLGCRLLRSASRGLIALTLSLSFSHAEADAAHDFIVSCSYGVLAGTLVGAASLAFASDPGNNLNQVARGASLGLYAGILLGAYVVYGVPSEDDDAARELGRTAAVEKRFDPPLKVFPVMSQRGALTGATAELRLFSF